MFNTKKETFLSLDEYRNLQRGVRSLRTQLCESEAALNNYEKNLIEGFSVSRESVFGPFTIVELTYGNYSAVGISRCSEKDNYNNDLGRKIALGRAQRKLLEKINKLNASTREAFAG